MLRLPEERNQELDVEAAAARLKLRHELLNAADLDRLEPSEEEQQEPQNQKPRGPLGISDLFKTDQMCSATQAKKIPAPDFKGAEVALNEYYGYDRIVDYQEDLRTMGLGELSIHEIMKLIPTPLTLPGVEKPPAPPEPKPTKLAKVAKTKELDEAELERLEASEEERKEANKPKKNERKPNAIENAVKWAISTYSRSVAIVSGKLLKDPSKADNAKAKAMASMPKATEALSFEAKPKLRAPEPFDTTLIKKSIEDQKSVEDLKPLEKQKNEHKSITPEEEVKLEQDFISLMKAAQSIRKTDEMLCKDVIAEKQRLSEQRQDELNKEFEKLAKRSWLSKIVQWVKAAVTTAMMVIGVVTLATGGFSAAFSLVGAALAVMAGGLQATKAVFDYQNRVGTAKILEIQYAMDSLKSSIRSQVSKMQQSMEAVTSYWQMMSQAAKSQQDAGRFVITGRSSAIG